MGIAEKQALTLERAREPSVSCPTCGTQTTAADLLAHVAQRCPGPRDPHPSAQWIKWADAMRLGIPKATMNKWVSLRYVRVRGEIQDRQYLLRDVAVRFAATLQRRKFTMVNRTRRTR